MADSGASQRGRPYDAFLSYSHAADGRLAPAVQRCLQRLTRPWYRLPAVRVFRDQASLSANPDLWATIQRALAASRYFVLLASPEAARSPWVAREVSFWQDHRDRETFLIALTDGEVWWDPATGDFDWDRTTALPEHLRGWFAAEPMWVDLTWARTETHLSLRHPRFRDACGTLAATVHGIPKDKLDSADVRAHRAATRLGTGIVAVLLLLLAITGIAFQQANGQRRTAERQRRVAEEQRAVATGQALQAGAENVRETQPLTSLRRSLAALQVKPTPEARAGLVTSLMTTHYAGERPPARTGRGLDADRHAAFSPDGRTLVTAGAGTGNELSVWDGGDDLGVRPALATLSGHTAEITDIAFSRDGRSLATAGRDDVVMLWDMADRAQPRRAGTITGVTGPEALAFSADGATLAVVGRGADGSLVLWDVRDRASPRRLGERTGVYDSSSVAFSPNGRTLVTATTRITGTEDADRGTLTLTQGSGATLWDVADRSRPQELTRLAGQGAVRAFSADGRLLATGGVENTASLWDVTTPARPRRLATLAGHTEFLRAMAFSPDDRTLATASFDQTVILWDVADPAHPARSATLAAQTSSVLAIAFSPDSGTLRTADERDTVTRWRVAARAQPTVAATMALDGAGEAVAVSPDSHTVATAGFDKSVLLWDVTDPARPTRLAKLTGHSGPVKGVAFAPDGLTLASGGGDSILLWDLTDRQHPRQSAAVARSSPVWTLAFDPERFLLSATGGKDFTDGWAALWDVHDRSAPNEVATFTLSIGREPNVFSADGASLALPGSPDDPGTAIWDVRDPAAPNRVPIAARQRYPLISLGNTASFGPDGRTLATARSATGTLWDFSDPARVQPLATLDAGRTSINRIVFHGGGNLLATANRDATVVLWDAGDRARTMPAATLRAPSASVNDLAFSPDGRFLATVASDATAVLWRLGDLPEVVADPVRLACAIAGPGMTREWWDENVPGLPYRPPCP